MSAVAAPLLRLQRAVMQPQLKDDISEALASICLPKPPVDIPATLEEAARRALKPATAVQLPYAVNYYPSGLRERTMGPHARGNVGVTRYYPTLDPKVVVDFEPGPPDKWFHDEKAKFFAERGILYIPIELRAQLTEDDFRKRYIDAKVRTERAKVEQGDAAALRNATLVEGVLGSPEFEAALDRRAMELARAEPSRSGRPVTGQALRHVAAKYKKELVAHYRDRMRHGRLGPDECYRELTGETERRSDG